MSDQISNLKTALEVFLKSMPVGVKFNICSFGSRFSFLWERSQTYSQETLDKAVHHVQGFGADYGGTEMYGPFEATFKRRYQDMNLEVFLLTDGEIWSQDQLFGLINDEIVKSKGTARVFSLGIGSGASTSLIEGIARAGNGFAQTVADNEKMDKKVVRMLRGALYPHITDYSLDIKYERAETSADDDFELVEKVMDGLQTDTAEVAGNRAGESQVLRKPMSLFDSSINNDGDSDMVDASVVDNKFDHLPTVPVPRYLQTPCQIPPLFPFSRATVYVLLSDATPNQQPKSVILKGTSRHGPLELEIPITEFAEKDSTIHCLAARKEIKELEEGRGWLTHAKDSNSKLLKEKHDGHFADMVEREAVRLGVKFQVGGKWCSFVAVEDDGEEKKVGQVEVDNAQEYDEPISPARLHALNAVKQNMFSNSQPAPLASFGDANMVENLQYSISDSLSKGRSNRGGLFGWFSGGSSKTGGLFSSTSGGSSNTSGGLFGSASARPPNTRGLFGSASKGSFHNSGAAFGGIQARRGPSSPGNSASGATAQSSMSNKSMPAQLFGASSFSNNQPPVVQAAALAPPAAPVNEELVAQYQSEMSAAAAMPLAEEAEEAEESGGEDMGFGLFDDGPAAPPAPKPINAEDPLQALTSLQTFSGSWSWSTDLERILGVTLEEITKLNLPSVVTGHAEKDDILATACAVLFFKSKLKEEEDIWEMLVEKAEGWLEDNVGEDGVKELKIVLQELF
jgi:hypothetical protein